MIIAELFLALTAVLGAAVAVPELVRSRRRRAAERAEADQAAAQLVAQHQAAEAARAAEAASTEATRRAESTHAEREAARVAQEAAAETARAEREAARAAQEAARVAQEAAEETARVAREAAAEADRRAAADRAAAETEAVRAAPHLIAAQVGARYRAGLRIPLEGALGAWQDEQARCEEKVTARRTELDTLLSRVPDWMKEWGIGRLGVVLAACLAPLVVAAESDLTYRMFEARLGGSTAFAFTPVLLILQAICVFFLCKGLGLHTGWEPRSSLSRRAHLVFGGASLVLILGVIIVLAPARSQARMDARLATAQAQLDDLLRQQQGGVQVNPTLLAARTGAVQAARSSRAEAGLEESVIAGIVALGEIVLVEGAVFAALLLPLPSARRRLAGARDAAAWADRGAAAIDARIDVADAGFDADLTDYLLEHGVRDPTAAITSGITVAMGIASVTAATLGGPSAEDEPPVDAAAETPAETPVEAPAETPADEAHAAPAAAAAGGDCTDLEELLDLV